MSERLCNIVADMAGRLDHATLQTIILNAIPERRMRDMYPTESTRRPGVAYGGSSARPTPMLVYDEEYCAQFPTHTSMDIESPIDYLETMRGAVQTRDPVVIADLLTEFDEYFAMPIPVFLQPIIILFKKWSEITTTNPHDITMLLRDMKAVHNVPYSGRQI
jgi:hypothetical protein